MGKSNVFKTEEGRNDVLKWYDIFLDKWALSYEKFYVNTKINGNQPIPEEMLRYQKLIGKNFNYRRETIPIFSDDELKLLTMPTVLFVGLKDIMLCSDKTAKRLESLLPQSEINILNEAGHSNINDVDKIITWFNMNI
jgi:pimeloyl-ACP methyl ester carboxylesterase